MVMVVWRRGGADWRSGSWPERKPRGSSLLVGFSCSDSGSGSGSGSHFVRRRLQAVLAHHQILHKMLRRTLTKATICASILQAPIIMTAQSVMLGLNQLQHLRHELTMFKPPSRQRRRLPVNKVAPAAMNAQPMYSNTPTAAVACEIGHGQASGCGWQRWMARWA